MKSLVIAKTDENDMRSQDKELFKKISKKAQEVMERRQSGRLLVSLEGVGECDLKHLLYYHCRIESPLNNRNM